MSRYARQISKTGLYHIIFRGIGRQNIFEEDSDYEKLKQIIHRVKEETQFHLYGYCFMTNHVHMFIKEQQPGAISKIMTKILSHYATWFNIKYLRVGSLFASRYKSEPVEDDKYFISLVRYIHQNPVKAKMVSQTESYPYSSYHEYALGKRYITDIDFLLDVIDENRDSAVKAFIQLHQIDDKETYEIGASRKNNPANIRRIIMNEIDGKEPGTIKELPKSERNLLIKKLVNEQGISKSALERATGISRGTIVRICNGVKKSAPQRRTLPSFLD